MISFIIIGRNVEKTIELCIQSVEKFIAHNKISSAEVIYVDSESTDESVNLAKKYQGRAIQLKGKVNAAAGRNEGAKAAEGDILFFIDGDMEILPECFTHFFETEEKLVYPFLTGNYANRYYTEDFKSIINTDYPDTSGKAVEFIMRSITGGLFIVEKKFWLKIGGMDTRLCANEDIDFALRLARCGIEQRFYTNLLLAIHHTISYYNSKRFSEFLFTPRSLCSGVLIRKHLLNLNYLPILFRSRYSMFLLIVAIITIVINHFIASIMVLCYLLIQIQRSYSIFKKEPYFLNILIYKITYDLYSAFGIIFYYPSKKISSL